MQRTPFWRRVPSTPFWRRDVDEVVDLAIDSASTFVVRQNRRYGELVEMGEREMVHTRICLDAPLRSGFAYTDAMHVALGMCQQRGRARVLCLGGGGGIVATQLSRAGSVVDVVERSELVIDLAAKHFGLRASPSLAVHHAEASQFLSATPLERYDCVVIDLFGAFEASALLIDRAFFERVAGILRDGGTVAVNAVGSLGGDGGALLATERAIGSAFGEVLSIPLLSDKERATRTIALDALRNVVLFASQHRFPPRVIARGPDDDLPTLGVATDDVNRRLRALDAARAQARSRGAVSCAPDYARERMCPTSATSSARFAAPIRV